MKIKQLKITNPKLYNKVIEMYKNCISVGNISKETNLPPHAVRIIAKIEEIYILKPHKRISEEIARLIVRDYLNNETSTEISNKYNISSVSVRCLLKRKGINIRPNCRKLINEMDVEEIKRLYAKSWNIKEIGKALGYSKENIRESLIRSNIKIRKSAKHMDFEDIYKLWIVKYGKEKADEMLIASRKKRSKSASGKNNPMYGKPSPKGSGNGFKCWYKRHFFRSLKELAYFLNEIEAKNKPYLSGEKSCFKIKFKFLGNDRTYKPDFLVDGKYLIEIKPIALHNSTIVSLKRDAALKFCVKNGYEYILTDYEVDYQQIKELYLAGKIKPMDKYKERFDNYFIV